MIVVRVRGERYRACLLADKHDVESGAVALKKSDLYSSLWRSCDELPGGMDAGQYRVVDARSLYYVFLTVDWRSMNEASGVPSLSSARVEGIKMTLPSLDEQRAIRKFLDDADSEVAALQARLAKAKSIKQGMMQQLLTGRTRLS